MKKLTVFILALAVLVFSSSIAVASFANFFWNGYMDYTLPPSPCAGQGEVSTSFTYNGKLWLAYNCADGTSWARQFTDTVVAASVVTTSPSVPQAPTSCTTINPGPPFVCVNGNWIYPQ